MAQTTDNRKHSEDEYFQIADNLIHHSCPALRSIFRRRWEQETGSPWSESSAEQFTTGIGREFFKGSKPIQKKCLKSGKLEDWDLPLVSNVLKQIPWENDSDQASISLRKREHQAIEKLVQLRNNSAHNSNKRLSEGDYKKVEEVVRAQLKELGLGREEIEGIVEKAGVLTPVSGWTTAKKILQKGDDQLQTGDYSKAVELYTEALQVPNLLQSNQAILLEKRAAARTALCEEMNTVPGRVACLNEAMADVIKSLEYDKDSWRAHQIIGRLHRHRNELESAVEHFNRALEISPGQNEVKAQLDFCKLLLGKIERAEGLDPRAKPMTWEERLKHFAVSKDIVEEALQGQSHVQNGHRYLGGWDVKQDYLEASRHYAKADKVENAEGTYHLAQLYLHGTGVQQWIARAVELLEKAANMSPEVILPGGYRLPNVGVRAAQHSLGLLYDQGVHVEVDATEAAKWYEKAANNGLGIASNNLGILYYEGRGVPKDMEKAIMYWKLGLRQKDMNAAASLFSYYWKRKEPELARYMFDKSIEFGNDNLKMEEKTVYGELEKMRGQRKRSEASLLEFQEFEMENNLTLNGSGAEGTIINTPGSSSTEEGRSGSGGMSQRTSEERISVTVPEASSSSTMPERNPKAYLENVRRHEKIKNHRTTLHNLRKKNEIPWTWGPPPEHKLPWSLTDLKSIKLSEMNTRKDLVYKGRILNLTIIEDPIKYKSSVCNVAEDEDGEVIRIQVYNFPRDYDYKEKLGFGCRLAIINPYMRFVSKDQNQNQICLDDPRCIIYNEGVIDMCRYCGEANAPRSCSRCKLAKYCSRECQTKDWEDLLHKLICTKKLY